MFESIAASAGVTHVALTVTAYSMGLETINEIEDAISKKEIRRDRITRDLEQRKKMLTAMLPKQSEIASTIIEVAVDDEEPPAEKE